MLPPATSNDWVAQQPGQHAADQALIMLFTDDPEELSLVR